MAQVGDEFQSLEDDIAGEVTPSKVVDLESQEDAMFKQDGIKEQEVPKPDVKTDEEEKETKEIPDKEKANPATNPNPATEEPVPDDTEAKETARQALVTRFKSETGYEGDLTLTLDGFIDATKAIKTAQEARIAAYEADEEIKLLAAHKAQGGTLQTFLTIPKLPDFDAMSAELLPEAIEAQERWVRQDLQSKGLKPTIVEATINSLKDTGALYDESKEAFENYKVNETTKFNNNQAEAQRRIDADAQLQVQSWNEALAVVDSNDFDGYTIKDKAELARFKASIQDKSIVAKWDNLTAAQQLILDYIVFNGFKLGSLGEKQGVIKPPVVPKNDVTLEMLQGGTGGGGKFSNEELEQQLLREFGVS